MSRFRQALAQAKLDRELRTPAAPEPTDSAERVPSWAPSAEPVWVPHPDEQPGEGVDDHLVSLLTPAAAEAEQYRALRHLLEQARRTAGVQVVAVSSPGVGDGKTTTAINAAGALAQAAGARVLLVDADLRKPSLARRLALGEPAGPGLVGAVVDPRLGLADIVTPLPTFNLHLVPAGRVPVTPYEILQSPRVGDIVAEARRSYDYILLDTAPLVSVPDTRLISQWVDRFLLVVAAHKTPSGQLAEALDLIDPARVLGLVFNEDDEARLAYHDRNHAVPTTGPRRHRPRPTWWPSFRRRP